MSEGLGLDGLRLADIGTLKPGSPGDATIIAIENGLTAASDVVVWPATAPVIVGGATAGSLSITVVVRFTVALA